jgi:hypothetical protein
MEQGSQKDLQGLGMSVLLTTISRRRVQLSKVFDILFEAQNIWIIFFLSNTLSKHLEIPTPTLL